MSDKYGYIGIETLLNFCSNDKNHCVTPNDFMRMNRIKIDERPRGEWNILQKDDNGIHEIECPFCKYSKGGRFASVGITFHKLPPFCEACGADMRKKEGDSE